MNSRADRLDQEPAADRQDGAEIAGWAATQLWREGGMDMSGRRGGLGRLQRLARSRDSRHGQ